jgi:hypothetical protein
MKMSYATGGAAGVVGVAGVIGMLGAGPFWRTLRQIAYA